MRWQFDPSGSGLVVPDPTVFRHDDERNLDVDYGWFPNPAGNRRIIASLPHPPELFAAAPDWQGDGMTGDHMPYLAYYEVEVPNWKAKGDEPGYKPQTGNNCTSEGASRGCELIQFLDIADPDPAAAQAIEFRRICVELVYAAGLAKAGMRGDQGCYGGPIASQLVDFGLMSYDEIDGIDDEDRNRLVQFANNPGAVVERYRPIANKFKMGKVIPVRTWDEACAVLANRGIVTVASSKGYVGSRDERGIIRQRGRWMHQMHYSGVIRSDGVETLVQSQSWGRNNPTGPQPFRMASFQWRTVRQDVESQLAEGDSWGVFGFPGFVRKPLPNRWTNRGWA